MVLLLWDPLGLKCKGGVAVGLVVRLASRDAPRMGKSGNGSTLGFEVRAGDAPYRECNAVGVCGREYDRARLENEDWEEADGMTQ
jgi:hypothetical protein